MTIKYFTTPADFIPSIFPDSRVDCVLPTAANMVWNVRLILNGNIFTLLTFRIVAMKQIDFPPQPKPETPEYNNIHLCLALLSKACSDKFNCVCAMPNIDVKLFELIYKHQDIEKFTSDVNKFIELLAEPRLDSKQSYIVTALHNLVANSVDTSRTGETLAYQKLFDGEDPG